MKLALQNVRSVARQYKFDRSVKMGKNRNQVNDHVEMEKPESRRLGDLTPTEISQEFSTWGVYMRIEPFLVHLQSSLSQVVKVFRYLYADYTIQKWGIADFDLRIAAPRSFRRWIFKQAIFLLDGESPFYPFPLQLANPLLEWGLNWCVSTRANQFLTLHAAVLERAGQALILPGPPGAGKSTLCAALVHRGWRLLSDEHALVRFPDSRLVPFPRPVALKDESIRVIREFAPEAKLGPAFEDTSKGTLAHMCPPSDSVKRSAETAVPSWIVFPKYSPESKAELKPVGKARAFLRAADNSFNYHLLGTVGFRTLARVIESTTCYDFVYDSLEDATTALSRLQSSRW